MNLGLALNIVGSPAHHWAAEAPPARSCVCRGVAMAYMVESRESTFAECSVTAAYRRAAMIQREEPSRQRQEIGFKSSHSSLS